MTFIKCLIRCSKTIARRTDPISYLTLKGSYLLCGQTDPLGIPVISVFTSQDFSDSRDCCRACKGAVPFSRSLACGG